LPDAPLKRCPGRIERHRFPGPLALKIIPDSIAPGTQAGRVALKLGFGIILTQCRKQGFAVIAQIKDGQAAFGSGQEQLAQRATGQGIAQLLVEGTGW
jgi:hypothetical protein